MKLVTCIGLCITALGLVSAEDIFGDMKQGFFACDQIRNVTILSLPYTPYYEIAYDHNDRLLQHLTFLVKAILDTPCIMVWIYSPLRARSIRQKQHNYNHFIDTEIASMVPPDNSLIVEFLIDFSKIDDRNQQVLLVIDGDYMRHYNKSQPSFIARYHELTPILIAINSLPNKSVTVWCTSRVEACYRSQVTYHWWIPRHRFVSSHGIGFNPHVHKVLYGLTMDQDYDQFKEYGSLQCLNQRRKLILRFCLNDDIYEVDQRLDYTISVFSSMPNVQVEVINFSYNFYSKRHYLFRRYRFHSPKKNNYLSKGEVYDMFRKPIWFSDLINIDIGFPWSDARIPRGMKHFGKWVNVNISDSISDSPRLKPDGTFVILEEDFASPIFIRMLIKKFKEIIC